MCLPHHKILEYLKMVLVGKITALDTWQFFLMRFQTWGSPNWKYCYKLSASQPSSGIHIWIFPAISSNVWWILPYEAGPTLFRGGWLLPASGTASCHGTAWCDRGQTRGLPVPVSVTDQLEWGVLKALPRTSSSLYSSLCTVLIPSNPISDLIFPL